MSFRQYDAIPLAPQNLTVSVSANNHPLLSWTKNNEPDIQHYKIYKKVTEELGFVPCCTSTTNSFEDLNEVYPRPGGIGITHPVQYKITAVDYHPFESPFSNAVVTFVSGASPEKINLGASSSKEYSLSQNYPNPFNPSTSISYQIKDRGFVTIKVYDMLGKEIVELVNETQESGQYSVTFDASNLPSGVYIYSLRVNDFIQNNKMTLLK